MEAGRPVRVVRNLFNNLVSRLLIMEAWAMMTAVEVTGSDYFLKTDLTV